MDVFTHDNSAGSYWGNSLKAGNIIFSRTESKNKHNHLKTGRALLMADETAYSALAGILDF